MYTVWAEKAQTPKLIIPNKSYQSSTRVLPVVMSPEEKCTALQIFHISRASLNQPKTPQLFKIYILFNDKKASPLEFSAYDFWFYVFWLKLFFLATAVCLRSQQ